jgi:hypothetical protein
VPGELIRIGLHGDDVEAERFQTVLDERLRGLLVAEQARHPHELL